MIKFVNSFRGTVVSIFVLSVALALVIPNPWPRAFILMGIVKELADVISLSKKDRSTLGFSVFAASIPSCFVFQTGAASMNQLVLSFSGITVSWAEWFVVMGLPGIALSAVYCVLVILLYPPHGHFGVDKDVIRRSLSSLGPLSCREKKTMLWMVAAIVIWLTDSIHGIHCAWTTMGIAVLMALPGIGGLLDEKSWNAVPTSTLIYLTAAVAIGQVGMKSGMTAWITENVLPSALPENEALLVLTICGFCMFFHLFLGSTIAANSVLVPCMLLLTKNSAISPLCCIMVTYTAIFGQYIFSYQHINILIGIGENGMYSERDSIKMALPLTICVPLVLVAIDVPWWSFMGLL